MGEPVEQGAGQPLGAEDLGPFIERQVRGELCRGLALVYRKRCAKTGVVTGRPARLWKTRPLMWSSVAGPSS